MPIVKCKICGKEEVRSMRRSDARCFPCKVKYHRENAMKRLRRLRKVVKPVD